MPFRSNHPCDLSSFSEFYVTDEVRDAFYSKPNVLIKRNYVVGVKKEEKACLQAEITKRYNSPKPRRLGYNPIPKWAWYAIRYIELSSPMNLHTGKEICYDPKSKDERPPHPLKRGKRVRRNSRPNKLKAFAAMIAENKQLERTNSTFALPGSLYDWVRLASAH
ncbi:hypothetical protein CJU89_1651 [Yarrowia sp. B02]|nr:hypothetical protein CJU89_1651 [Yarrowia sp. B02]